MVSTSVIKKLIGVNEIIVKNVSVEVVGGKESVVVDGSLFKKDESRCPFCHKNLPKYDKGRKARYWHCKDIGSTRVYIRTSTGRVCCPEHGVHTQFVPWARHRSRFIRNFEDNVAWLSLNTSKKTVTEYMQISWNSIGPILERVEKDLSANMPNRFDNLMRIGIDETSCRKGHNYITTVLNHDNGKLVWVGEGNSEETLSRFFEALTEEQRNNIRLVSADGAKWIAKCVRKYCPKAELCIDPFHVVKWAQDVLEKVKSRCVAEARKKMLTAKPHRGRGRPANGIRTVTPEEEHYRTIKNSKYPLLKNPENLTEPQSAKLRMILLDNPVLARAYKLKEFLRETFKLPPEDVEGHIMKWRRKAWTSRIPEFVDFQRKLKKHIPAILSTIKYRLSNAKIEAINNKIKLLQRRAYGFKNISNMFALIMLQCGNYEISLLNR